MFRTIDNLITMGGHCITAMLVYLGITLAVLGIAFDTAMLAQSGGTGSVQTCTHQEPQTNEDGSVTMVNVPGCEEGKSCCNGTCIDDETEICCDDGSSGDTETCGCCDGAISCDDPAP